MSLFGNQSWPVGEWKLEYVKDIDRWRIKTEFDQWVADVGPTLAASWIVETYNAAYHVYKKLR
jgi:hypothetical protein